jgi:hypothetical protein
MNFNRIRRFLGSLAGRVGTGALAFLALAVLLWPSAKWALDPEKLVAFLSALGIWIWSEVQSGGEPHPHDVQLFQSFLTTITEEERRNLAEHDMGAPFPANAFDGADQIYTKWKGPAYEFDDWRLKKKWHEVHDALRKFGIHLHTHTGCHPSARHMATVMTTQDFQTGTRSPLTIQRAQELNDLAATLSRKMDEFERAARERLRV